MEAAPGADAGGCGRRCGATPKGRCWWCRGLYGRLNKRSLTAVPRWWGGAVGNPSAIAELAMISPLLVSLTRCGNSMPSTITKPVFGDPMS